MTSILLRNGYVITVDPNRRVSPNGYVHVVGERIAAIGPMDRLARPVADEVDEVLDVDGQAHSGYDSRTDARGFPQAQVRSLRLADHPREIRPARSALGAVPLRRQRADLGAPHTNPVDAAADSAEQDR